MYCSKCSCESGIPSLKRCTTRISLWEELTGKPGKRLGEMIGKYNTVEERQLASRRGQYLYVPLPFSYGALQLIGETGEHDPRTQQKNTKPCTEEHDTYFRNALPIVRHGMSEIVFDVHFAERAKCYVVPPSAVSRDPTFAVYERPDDAFDAQVASASSLVPFSDASLQCTIETTHAYLDSEDRKDVFSGYHAPHHLQVQSMHSKVCDPHVRLRLPFSHVVKEIFFAVRPQANADRNEHFDFGGFCDPDTNQVYEPVREAAVYNGSYARVLARPGRYFRLLQSYQHHDSVPRSFVYNWSYATQPENVLAPGGVNYSHIDDIELRLELDPRLFADGATADVFVYAHNENRTYSDNGIARHHWGTE
jgi:hypothetical protein